MLQEMLYIKLNKITFQDCFIVVSDLLEHLNLSSKVSVKTYIDTIKKQNCNLRQILQSLILTVEKPKSSLELITSLSNTTISGEETKVTGNVHDMNIYEITQYFLKNRINERFLNINYYGMTNYLIYESFLPLFISKSKDKTHSIKSYKSFLQNTILINNDILQQENHLAYTFLEYYSTNKTNINLLGTANINTILKFTSMFNKLSMQSTFNKKINILKNQQNAYKPYVRAICVKDNSLDFIKKKMLIDFP
jgi:hypothetical protein